MKDILQELIENLVDNPDKVAIEEVTEDGITNYIVSVDKEDMGKIIGKEGKVIRSLRNVMKIKAMKQGVRINISLHEEEAAE